MSTSQVDRFIAAPVPPYDPFALESASLMRMITGVEGVEIHDRFHHLRRYPACFLGNELVDLLVERRGMTRRQAVRIGQRLLAQEHIRHVAAEHDFKDEPLFYAIGGGQSDELPEKIELSFEALAGLVRQMRGSNGIKVGRNRRLLVDYPDCFVASDAVNWLCQHGQMDRPQAITVARTLLQRDFIRHVFDEMHFEDGRHLYRFV